MDFCFTIECPDNSSRRRWTFGTSFVATKSFNQCSKSLIEIHFLGRETLIYASHVLSFTFPFFFSMISLVLLILLYCWYRFLAFLSLEVYSMSWDAHFSQSVVWRDFFLPFLVTFLPFGINLILLLHFFLPLIHFPFLLFFLVFFLPFLPFFLRDLVPDFVFLSFLDFFVNFLFFLLLLDFFAFSPFFPASLLFKLCLIDLSKLFGFSSRDWKSKVLITCRYEKYSFFVKTWKNDSNQDQR